MKFSRITRYLCLSLAGVFFLTGCFEIKEEITFKKDMSGTMTYTINMSGMKEMIGMLGSMGGEKSEGKKFDMGEATGKIKETVSEMTSSLKNIKGVSNIKDVSKPDDLIYSVKFNFTNIDVLNAAINALGGGKGKTGSFTLSADKKTITRSMEMGGGPGLDQLGDIAGEGEEAQKNLEMAKMFLGSAKYSMVLNFKSKVAAANCEAATVTNGKKSSTIEIPFLKLMEAKGEVKSAVILK